VGLETNSTLKKMTDICNVMLTSYPEHRIIDVERHMLLQH